MKILLFSTQWPEYMIELANSMANYGRVSLMLPSNHRLSPNHLKLIDKRVDFRPFHLVLHKSIRDNTKMLWSILNSIWKVRPDIMHIQANGHRLFYWIFLLKPTRSKIINTIHDPVKHTGDKASSQIKDRTVISWSRIFTKKFIVHGEVLKVQLGKSYRVDPRKIHVIPHGHFGIYRQLQRHPVEEETGAILFFGRIWKYKGIQHFIEAGNRVVEKFPKTKFYIVGAGEDISTYLEKIRHPKNFVIVNRRVPIEEAGEYFERSSVVVLPYLEATQSGVIPVAYAYAKPVIATNVGAIPEVVIDGQTGFLINPADPALLTKKIIYLLQNPLKRVEMGQEALHFAHSSLSWEKIAEKTFTLYRDVYHLNG